MSMLVVYALTITDKSKYLLLLFKGFCNKIASDSVAFQTLRGISIFVFFFFMGMRLNGAVAGLYCNYTTLLLLIRPIGNSVILKGGSHGAHFSISVIAYNIQR